MTIIGNGKQRRVKRRSTVDGMDVEECIRANTAPRTGFGNRAMHNEKEVVERITWTDEFTSCDCAEPSGDTGRGMLY